jgi:protein-disulfide isomerase
MEQQAVASNKFIPILVVLLIVASFLIGSLYTQVNLLKKGTGAPSVAAPTANDNAPAAPEEPTGPLTAEIDVAKIPVLGKEGAKVAVIEFTDYQCPFCGQLFTNAFPSIKKDYIDTGKIRYYVKDFPLTQIHPQAQKAAEAANCATDQNKFWEYHDKLFANQTALAVDDLKKYATELGLNAGTFASCLDSSKYKDKVASDQKAGEGYGVRGTPSSFVGILEGDKVKNALPVSGAVPYETFKTTIEDVLKKV